MVAKPRYLGHATPKRGSIIVVKLRHLCLTFFLNTSEVYKKLLVKYPETFQHICMSILVINKTITFVAHENLQILCDRLKKLRFNNHFKFKRIGCGTHASKNTLGFAPMPDSGYLGLVFKNKRMDLIWLPNPVT